MNYHLKVILIVILGSNRRWNRRFYQTFAEQEDWVRIRSSAVATNSNVSLQVLSAAYQQHLEGKNKKTTLNSQHPSLPIPYVLTAFRSLLQMTFR